ncbi:ADP-ribosylation [Neocallimastix lanati (nom. inval.)]|uniref:ADP-ribosylation n=1 Tax=Neocallimastix californiae TaxID=1754190 RepID=A0A1Y2EU62_9FUNG|nr:ADP-ribosylation [Neocallimastix sp. JGI-2020a]ORY74395.1 ADP-ribosylation [Neocallimastix californiae]|eukprot:ORY74395.1 ADP-ribosylation [Neocallimastix californiae]
MSMSMSSSSSQQSLVRKRIHNILGCDLLVDFFSASIYSNNAEYLCDPFPKQYMIDNNANISPNLRYRQKTLKDIKRVKSLLDNMEKLTRIENPEDNELLNWIINSEVQLKRVLKIAIENDELVNNDSIDDLVKSKSMNLNSSSFYLSSESIDMENNDLYDYVPSFIFKVNYTNKNNDPEEKLPRCIQHNLEFEKLKKEYGSFYGYHGSLFENFHSILHYGLQTNLNKRSAYGKGIYVSVDLKLSFTFSKGHVGRGKKSLIGKGNPIVVLALCEIIKHPDIMRKQRDDSGLYDDLPPDEYFIIKNNAHIRVTHLLVYVNKKETMKASNKFIKFIHDHFIILIFIFYFLLMCYLGNR